MAVFPNLRGAALVGAAWGTVHLLGGGLLASVWSRLTPAAEAPRAVETPQPG